MRLAPERARALDAAIEIARAYDVRVAEIRVVRNVHNIVAALDPAPVVVKIDIGAIPEFAGRLSTELSVLKHLARAQAPAIRPSALVDPGPHFVGDATIIFLEYEHHVARQRPSNDSITASLRAIHEGLREYNGALPSFRDQLAVARRLLDPERSPMLSGVEREFLIRAHADLADGIPQSPNEQPLHGDPWLGNALVTPRGMVYLDFEAACTGPREWDWTMVPEGCADAVEDLDRALLLQLRIVRTMVSAIWCWESFEKSVDIANAAKHHLERLHALMGL